jgi:hypothetical protein
VRVHGTRREPGMRVLNAADPHQVTLRTDLKRCAAA